MDIKLTGKKRLEGDTFQECRRRLLEQLISGRETEAEKSAKERRIEAKLSAGAKLTSGELSYIRRNFPEQYVHVLRVQHKRESILNQLENCKSKQEAEDILSFELGAVSKDDPDKKLLIAAIQNAFEEFKKSDRYGRLPEQEFERRRGKDIWYRHTKSGDMLAYCFGSGTYQETYGLDLEAEATGFDTEG